VHVARTEYLTLMHVGIAIATATTPGGSGTVITAGTTTAAVTTTTPVATHRLRRIATIPIAATAAAQLAAGHGHPKSPCP